MFFRDDFVSLLETHARIASKISRELARHGIVHTYEEFDGTHSGIDYRLERSLPFLTRALATG